ncbi:5-formyltetrahydrofolate cyclo-ligase [Streptomyces sp. NPDC060194]|uniref:5-formyltetrahydrofolate cyclo-ligase n=1 Tax=Streptomyces sp. NPDC060194 TaxID=3347069 RepID=UPI00366863C4
MATNAGDGPESVPDEAASGGVPEEAAKHALRRELLAARRALTDGQVASSGAALARAAVTLPELADARTVAAYVSVGREPGTLPLLDALLARGVRVLLPVLLPDNDLDWAAYGGPQGLVAGPRGLREPSGPRLGPDAVLKADAVLLPGLAVDTRGMRLGRGGGSYDRVLARLDAAGARPALVVLLHEGEVRAQVPSLAHDRPVQAAVTPSGVRRFTDGAA